MILVRWPATIISIAALLVSIPCNLTGASNATIASQKREAPAARKKSQTKKTEPRAESATQQENRALAVEESDVSQIRSGVAPDGKGKLWAVIVGVSSYKNLAPDAQLNFAHQDAESFADFLRSPGGGGFPSSQIRLLLNQEATLAALRTALGTWLPRSAQSSDVVYIFFAGHGVVEGESDGYLLTHDSDPQNLYATALSVSEVDRIIAERVRARVTVVIADACHSGNLGLTSRSLEEQVLINRYLDEIGKSGAGVFRLLASRANERSYEDKRWGGGHGVFTHFLLEGLRGRADSDKDGVVRAAELLSFLSEIVPEQTQALQHPHAAGSIDPRLPFAILPNAAAHAASNAAIQPNVVLLEVRGAPGSEVYIDNAYRGRIRPNGILVVEALSAGEHDMSIDPPGAETFTQSISLAAERTLIDLNTVLPARASVQSSPLVDLIRRQIARGKILGAGGAWELYQQLKRDAANDPQLASVETEMIGALEEVGQRAINDYVRPASQQANPDMVRRAAVAYGNLMTFNRADAQLEAKKLLCEGRTLITEGKSKEAIVVLRRSILLDPRSASSYNALGVAYEKEEADDEAREAFKQAIALSPQWVVPRLRLAIHYYAHGEKEEAEREFKTAAQIDPRYRFARGLLIARHLRERKRYAEAEREAIDLIRSAPNYGPAYLELGLIYESDQQYRRAADAFDAYLRLAASSGGDPSIDIAAVRARAKRNRQLAQRLPW